MVEHLLNADAAHQYCVIVENLRDAHFAIAGNVVAVVGHGIYLKYGAIDAYLYFSDTSSLGWYA